MHRPDDAPQGAHRRLPPALAALLAAVSAIVIAIACGRAATAPSPPATALAPGTAAAATATAPVGTPAPTTTPEAVADEVTIAAVGDLMFAREVTDLMTEHGADYPFARVRALFAGADVVVGNLEGTFTDRGAPLAKRYTFRAPPALAATLTSAGFDAVTLANNHAYDFGNDGLMDTLAAVRATGTAAFGAGADEAAARAPAIVEARGVRIALLGYNDIGEVRMAQGADPGVARADEALIARDGAAAAAAADFVVVFMHWGVEYSREPTERQRALARVAVAAGASAVIGSHPHVLQPWVRVDDAVVLYSLGNFVFDLDPDDWATLGPEPFETAVALITLRRHGAPAVEWRPALIDPVENRPRPPTAAEAPAILARLGDGDGGDAER
ncbi:MAG: CapA family protein [Dehalococcoidia bacterium]